jgi:hypothetical protein
MLDAELGETGRHYGVAGACSPHTVRRPPAAGQIPCGARQRPGSDRAASAGGRAATAGGYGHGTTPLSRKNSEYLTYPQR